MNNTGCTKDNQTGAAVRFNSGLLLMAVAIALTGCGGKLGKQQEFFTSGSREADQRASQKMAKQQQLAESGKGGALFKSKQALYERLGGEQGLAAIVDDFINRALEDPRVNWERSSVKTGGLFHRGKPLIWQATPENVATLKKHLVQFFSLISGGPSQYDGKPIKSTHAGMSISNPEFEAAIGDLKATLDKLQIGETEQKELLALVETTRPEIVTER